MPSLLHEVPSKAPAVGGTGDHAFRVNVTDPWGQPVAAGVIFVWAENEQSDGSLPATLDIGVLRLRSDNGVVQGMVPGNRTMALIVYPSNSQDFASDWRFDIPAGTKHIDFVVTPHFFEVTHNITLNPLQAGGPLPQSRTYAQGPWSNDAAANEAFARRLVSFEIELAWTNALDSRADLGIVVADDDRSHYADQNDVMDGAKSEQMSKSIAQTEDAGLRHDRSTQFGIWTNTGVVGLEPVEATFHIRGGFGANSLDAFACGKYEGHEAEFTEMRWKPEQEAAGSEDAAIPGLGIVAILGLLVIAARRK